MVVSKAPRFVSELQVRSSRPAPHIVVGITSPQTCLTLTGRLRALREAGFRVTLVSSPGELLDLTAAREGVESIAIPMERIADCGSCFAGEDLVATSPAQA